MFCSSAYQTIMKCLACFKRFTKSPDKEGSKNLGFNDYGFDEHPVSVEKRGMSVVELIKKEGSTLGIILTGGVDKGSRARICNLRPGSIAHRSDSLSVGDYITGVNGIRTENLKHDEIVNLLINADERVILDLEYEIPDSPTESVMSVCSKVVQIRLRKENGSFGFTVRGGVCDEKLKTRPLIVTQIRPGGCADREGTIKPGDRLLAVDNFNLTNASHSEALCILKQTEGDAIFTVEYDVSIMDSVKHALGPLLVEIEKSPGSQLGIALASATNGTESTIIIESIKQASIAERSGALHVGDQILAVDGTRTDHMTPAEVMQLLKLCVSDAIKLEILPISQMALQRVPETTIRKGTFTPPGTSSSQKSAFANLSGNANYSNYNTLSSMTGLAAKYSRNKRNKNLQRKNSLTGSDLYNGLSTNASGSTGIGPCTQVCHAETTEVALAADCMSYGLTVKSGTFTSDELTCYPVIANVDPGGAAERSGVIQVGDRLITVNRQQTNQLTIDEIMQIISESEPRLLLAIQFDVAESVVPSSGTFNVKLPKYDGGLGISITSPKNRRCGEPLTISHVKKGSVAHRTGTIQPGDLLVAIDSVRMDNCTVEDAAQILKNAENIVQLRIKKDEAFSEDSENDKSVVYTMEMVRHGGPLGITISGTEEAFDPVIISGLTSNGLAEKTGALHVGDRLLAINGETLRGKNLSEAIQMLQNSGDVVTLKISKDFSKMADNEKTERIDADLQLQHAEPGLETYKVSTPLPSVDSAVESWDSSGMYDANTSGSGSHAASSRPNSGNTEEGVSTEDSSKRSSEIVSNNGEETTLTSWRREKWKRSSSQKSSPSQSSSHDKEDWSKVLEDLETCGQSLILRQLEKSIIGSDDDNVSMSTSSAFETVRRNPNMSASKAPSLRFNKWRAQQMEIEKLRNGNERFSTIPHSATRLVRSDDEVYAGTDIPVPSTVEIHKVTLFKDGGYDDFGFSVSDGLYERGVFVNRIRPGGPADQCGLLRPFDRLLQVNETKTEDFDCCLIVPLIAASGDQIDLVFSRKPENHIVRRTTPNGSWMDESTRTSSSSPLQSSTTITKTL